MSVARLGWGRFVKPYYAANTFALASYWYVRGALDTEPLMREDWFGFARETQLLVLLAVSLGVQYQKSATLDEWLGKLFVWGKVAMLALLFSCDRRAAAWYALAFLVMALLLPQPEYRGATRVQRMSGGEFEDVVEGNAEPHTVWLVEFYASWAQSCTHFAAVFAALSLRYGTARLRFAAVDVGRSTALAERHGVSVAAFGNRELPTVLLFEGGRPAPGLRVPPKDAATGKVTPVVMYERNLATFFELERRRAESLLPVPAAEQAAAVSAKVMKKRRR